MAWEVLKKNTTLVGYVRGDEFGYSSRSKLPTEITVELRIDKDERKYELSIWGDIWSPRKADIVVGGQINDTLSELIQKKAFISVVPKYNLNKLLKIWKVWHLNSVKPVPYELKDAYLNFVAKYMRKYGDYPPYAVLKEAFPQYGERWCFWPIPRATLKWIIAKWLVDYGENAYKETDRILLEIDKLEVRGDDF